MRKHKQSSAFDDANYDDHHDAATGDHSLAGIPDGKEHQSDGRQFVHPPSDRTPGPNRTAWGAPQ
jgi:hypothetical protein